MTGRTESAAVGIERQLARYRDLTYRALLGQLPTREPRRYLYDLISGQLSHVGKGLRPALCIATCRAFGGSIEQALPSAVTIELLHNAFLVHDDIEDGSLYRRNRATLYIEEGVPIAVNVGDAMNAISIGSLTENIPVLGAELAYRIFHEAQHLVLQSVEGQALELGWTRDNIFDLTEDDYLRLVLKKTCWYTCIHPCRIGALIGTAGAIDADRFNLFGFLLGASFPSHASSARSGTWSGSFGCSSATPASISPALPCGRWSRRRWMSSTSRIAMRRPRRIATSFVS